MFATPEKPLVAAISDWRDSIEATVAARMETRPVMQSATRRLETAVAAVWQRPEAVLSALRNLIDDGRVLVADLAQSIRDNPASVGELHGSRSMFGRNDGVREKALAAVSPAISALQDYGQVRSNLRNDLTKDEQRFRTLMREPVDDLSQAARELVGRIERTPADRLGTLIRSADDQQAMGELRRFVETVRDRFGLPGTNELDRDRLAQAMPGADQERVEAFAAGYAKADQLVTTVQAAQQAQKIEMAHEQQQTRGREKGHGISY